MEKRPWQSTASRFLTANEFRSQDYQAVDMQEYEEGDMEDAPEGSDGSHEVSHSQMFDPVPSD